MRHIQKVPIPVIYDLGAKIQMIFCFFVIWIFLKVRDIWIFWPIVTDCTFISSSVIINSDNAYFNSRLPLLYLSRPNNDPAIKVDLQFLQMQIVAKLQSKDLHFVLQGNYSTCTLSTIRKKGVFFFFMTSNVVIKTRILLKKIQ